MSSEKKVLITGASGFVATHIVEAFLPAGYKVRGTVRCEQTANLVRQTFRVCAEAGVFRSTGHREAFRVQRSGSGCRRGCPYRKPFQDRRGGQ